MSKIYISYVVFVHNSLLTAPQTLGISSVLKVIRVSFVILMR